MTTMRFFLCGSWTVGMVNFAKIQTYVDTLKQGQVIAKAVRTKLGFPLLLKEQADRVWGQVAEVQVSDLLLSILDEFHGVNHSDLSKGLHTRETTTVELEDGTQVEAWAYFANPKKVPAGSVEIHSGDWKKSLEDQPSLIETLTERQATYVKKLGSATGRDIVPIQDLSLYRELMNLELIVDKGRRLALSKLGKEVYRHLV